MAGHKYVQVRYLGLEVVHPSALNHNIKAATIQGILTNGIGFSGCSSSTYDRVWGLDSAKFRVYYSRCEEP